MKVFISWSGKDSVSQKVADELSKWLPMIIQNVEAWVSTDITSGDRWNETINKNLSESVMGIICVTKENIVAPWLNFEAGAIAKGITSNKVIPLLIDLKPSDLSKSPLSQFQAKSIEKNSIFELLSDINELSEKSIQKELLTTLFNHCWDDFVKKIDGILEKTPTQKTDVENITRPAEEILEEVLSLTRDIKSDLSFRVNRLEQVFEIINRDNYSIDFRNKIISENNWTDVEIRANILNYIKDMYDADTDPSVIVEKLRNIYGLSTKTAFNYLNDFLILNNKKMDIKNNQKAEATKK